MGIQRTAHQILVSGWYGLGGYQLNIHSLYTSIWWTAHSILVDGWYGLGGYQLNIHSLYEVFTLPHVFRASPRGLARSPHGVRAILSGSLCGVRAFMLNKCSDSRTCSD
jgi:hypothetical protein